MRSDIPADVLSLSYLYRLQVATWRSRLLSTYRKVFKHTLLTNHKNHKKSNEHPFLTPEYFVLLKPPLILRQYNECNKKKSLGSLLLKATILISQHKAMAAILQVFYCEYSLREPLVKPLQRGS